MQARCKLERIIRDAVMHDRFELHYQPLFEMSDRRLIGFEALIRLPTEDGMRHPTAGVHPCRRGLAADRQDRRLGIAGGLPDRRNLAGHPERCGESLAHAILAGFSGEVAAALNETGLTANRLELEITETLLLGNSQVIMAELHALKAMGVAIVMDDFGTGYSSLSYLWQFPFDKIKIDRSFMQGFDGHNRNAGTVVKTLIALGRELNMRVTVEGVETAAQAAFLDKIGGDQAQGYFFGRPVPAQRVSAHILKDFQARHAVPSSPWRAGRKTAPG